MVLAPDIQEHVGRVVFDVDLLGSQFEIAGLPHIRGSEEIEHRCPRGGVTINDVIPGLDHVPVLSIFGEIGGEEDLVHPSTLARFIVPRDVSGSSRALGWDTMRVTSSCGTKMTTSAIGHTGFTGTSVWIDPELDLYVVLLSNRIHPNRKNETMAKLRPLVHDAIVEAW